MRLMVRPKGLMMPAEFKTVTCWACGGTGRRPHEKMTTAALEQAKMEEIKRLEARNRPRVTFFPTAEEIAELNRADEQDRT
jgi:hypothetical protein